MTPLAGNLAVVILNWRNEVRTLCCVERVRGWSELKPNIYVVDNESTAASKEILATALGPADLICSNANRGYGGGNNLGIEQALRGSAEFVLLLNSDAEISESGVARLIDRHAANPGIAILGPVIYERQQTGSVQCLIGGKDIARNKLTRVAADPNELSRLPGYPLNDVDYVPGAVFLARRSLFERMGLLDEEFFFSGEIADLCKRAKDSGQRACVDLEVAAHHAMRQTPEPLRATLYVYYSLRNRLLYAKKHYPLERAKYLALWSKLCLLEFARASAKGERQKARAILFAFMHGCSNQFGNQNAAFL